MKNKFSKLAFPVLRKVLPKLIQSNIVKIQPMNAPASSIFFHDYVAFPHWITIDKQLDLFNEGK